MKLVHAADLHLDSALAGLTRYESAPADEIRGATRRAFSNLVSLCLEERAALLVISGDLFDGDWRDISTGLFFAAQLTKLCEAGVQVVWIRGNHDAVSQIRRSVRLPEAVIELLSERAETRVFDRLGVAVHGRSFAKRDVTEDLAATYPDRVRSLTLRLKHEFADTFDIGVSSANIHRFRSASLPFETGEPAHGKNADEIDHHVDTAVRQRDSDDSAG